MRVLLSICGDKAVDALAHGVDQNHGAGKNGSAYERNAFENEGAVNAYATTLLDLAGKVDAFDRGTSFQSFLSTNGMPHHKGGDIDMFFLSALLGTDVLVCGGAMVEGVHPVDASFLSVMMDTVGLKSADALRTGLLVAQQTFTAVVNATGVKREHHYRAPMCADGAHYSAMKTAYHAASEYDDWQSEDPVDVPGLQGWGMNLVRGHSAHPKGVLQFTNHMTHRTFIDDPRKEWGTTRMQAAAAHASAHGPSDKLSVLRANSSGMHASTQIGRSCRRRARREEKVHSWMRMGQSCSQATKTRSFRTRRTTPPR